MSMAKLRGVMAERGYSAARLAKEAEMNVDTMRRKLQTGKFLIEEANQIARILGIQDINAIFFANEST